MSLNDLDAQIAALERELAGEESACISSTSDGEEAVDDELAAIPQLPTHLLPPATGKTNENELKKLAKVAKARAKKGQDDGARKKRKKSKPPKDGETALGSHAKRRKETDSKPTSWEAKLTERPEALPQEDRLAFHQAVASDDSDEDWMTGPSSISKPSCSLFGCETCELGFASAAELSKHRHSQTHRAAINAQLELQTGGISLKLEKKSMHCRVCETYFETKEELETHRETKEHALKMRQDRASSECKLCRKSFTSPDQLAEHKNGKWHRMREQQQDEGKPAHGVHDRGGRSGAGGRGGGVGRGFGDSSGRGRGSECSRPGREIGVSRGSNRGRSVSRGAFSHRGGGSGIR